MFEGYPTGAPKQTAKGVTRVAPFVFTVSAKTCRIGNVCFWATAGKGPERCAAQTLLRLVRYCSNQYSPVAVVSLIPAAMSTLSVSWNNPRIALNLPVPPVSNMVPEYVVCFFPSDPTVVRTAPLKRAKTLSLLAMGTNDPVHRPAKAREAPLSQVRVQLRVERAPFRMEHIAEREARLHLNPRGLRTLAGCLRRDRQVRSVLIHDLPPSTQLRPSYA